MNSARDNAGSNSHYAPPKLMENRDRYLVYALLALFAGGAIVILFFFNPSQHSFYPICYFHSVTGLLCPGCGSLRALHQLLHGNVLEAARLNALLLFCLLILGWIVVPRFITLRRQQQVRTLPIKPALLWIFLCVTITFTVLRNLHLAWRLAP